MKQLTDQQFSAMREGLAGAHLLFQRLGPILKQRHVALDKDTRALMALVPQPLREAFAIASQLTTDADMEAMRAPKEKATPLQDVDPRTFREELENTSALTLPDLVYEMRMALSELPMFNHTAEQYSLSYEGTAQLMAWTWEAGRRYAFIEAIAVFEATSNELHAAVMEALSNARDRNLELPAAEPIPDAQRGQESEEEPGDDSDPDAPPKKGPVAVQ